MSVWVGMTNPMFLARVMCVPASAALRRVVLSNMGLRTESGISGWVRLRQMMFWPGCNSFKWMLNLRWMERWVT